MPRFRYLHRNLPFIRGLHDRWSVPIFLLAQASSDVVFCSFLDSFCAADYFAESLFIP
jgi:hypothetical protein